MLQPSRVKFRKQHTSNFKGRAHAGTTVAFGDFGLQAEEQTWLTARQIEAARRAMTRHVKRGGKVWIRVFPDRPISKKPAEVRMGNGKGATDHWAAQIKPGRMLFEMGDVTEDVAKEAMRLAGSKLPIRTKFVKRENGGTAGAVTSTETKEEVA